MRTASRAPHEPSMNAHPNTAWYLEGADGNAIGPYTTVEVLARLRGGFIDRTSLACRADGEDWLPVGEWPEFARPSPQPNTATAPTIEPLTPGQVKLGLGVVALLAVLAFEWVRAAGTASRAPTATGAARPEPAKPAPDPHCTACFDRLRDLCPKAIDRQSNARALCLARCMGVPAGVGPGQRADCFAACRGVEGAVFDIGACLSMSSKDRDYLEDCNACRTPPP